MTVKNPAIFLQASLHPAEDVRRFIATLFGDQEGIFLSTDLAVTEKSGTPNMSVDVAGGRCVIKGDSATYQGSYFMENRGVANVAITTADPTNPRIDRVIAEVLDAAYSGVTNAWQIRVVAGTPAGSPSAPALPNNAISLATVSVPAADTIINNAQITDTRPRLLETTQGFVSSAVVAYNLTTTPTSTGATFTLPAGRWLIQAKGEGANVTGSSEQVTTEIYNSTGSVVLDTTRWFANGIFRIPVVNLAVVTLAVNSLIQWRAFSNLGDGSANHAINAGLMTATALAP